jgi:hypothetical protein
MATVRASPTFGGELARLIASQPTRQQLLQFRPSEKLKRRAEKLLQKQNDGEITYEEQQELEEFAHTERVVRLMKAKLRAQRVAKR